MVSDAPSAGGGGGLPIWARRDSDGEASNADMAGSSRFVGTSRCGAGEKSCEDGL